VPRLGPLLLAFGIASWACSARAEEPARSQTPHEPEAPCRAPGRRALAGAASVVPGIVLHGSGHFVLCEPETARKLAVLEGAGAVSLAGSTAGLALTGASRYLVAPLAIGAWAGASLFVLTFLADVYGVANSERQPLPVLRPPRLAVETGLRYVYDPQFSYRAFVIELFRLDLSPFWLEPRLDAAIGASNQRYALLAGHRLLGTTRRRLARDETYLEVRAGLADHAYAEDGFAMTTAELSLAGRLDLVRLGRTLVGSFAEAELGFAHQWSRFDGLPGDQTDELLLRTSFGASFGAGNIRGETRLAYNHRRDTLAGGIRAAGIPAGYLGFLEHRSELYVGPRFGVATEVNYGSAFILGASFLMRVEQ
jgi:hypothetical protein